MFTRILILAGSCLVLAGSSAAQSRYFFSGNWHGPSVGMPSSSGGTPCIVEVDLLVPPIVGGVSPFPGILISAESLGLASRRRQRRG